ncbi:sensor histidine kinase [Thermosulfurimonas marina]|uniref:sensor histidine kinase n=1 Tax=Thermosulfurimonas marina TaxID=2047767 RepID=UPI00144A5D44|nr:HAMP domain-containing sensor histidine kinase [Thermosulfurimonas marina]
MWRKFLGKKAPSPAPVSEEGASLPLEEILQEWPLPAAVVDRQRGVPWSSRALKALSPSGELQHLLELPFSELVEIHRRLFEEGEVEEEVEYRERAFRVLGRRISSELAVLALVEVTRERTLEKELRFLASTLAHEFRTPLTALQGYVEALEEELPAEGYPREILSAIREHLHRLTRLVKELLELSRLSGRDLRCEALPVAALLQALRRAAEPLLQPKGLRLEIHPEKDLTVRGDPDYLVQALLKVLENAVRYSPEGGRIIIEVRSQGKKVRIAIRDEGPGVPEELRSRIFEPLVRGKNSPGLGLGLALARRLVCLQGGDLLLEPSGQGATFVFLLPVSSPEVQNFATGKG